MLGRTASGLFWMFRQLERSENTARLVEAGMRMSLTRAAAGENEWASIVMTAGASDGYQQVHDGYDADRVIDFLLCDKRNPSSVLSLFEAARGNARMVRTALTREVWENVNEGWLALKDTLSKPVTASQLPDVLSLIRQRSALVRGSWNGTALRNDIYAFARLGTRLERADNTARILDVKYYVLLPSVSQVGSSLDNVQWESILRSASAARSFNWLYGGESSPSKIAEFLILNPQMPRSLIFCSADYVRALDTLCTLYGERSDSRALAYGLHESLESQTIEDVFKTGLHEYLGGFMIRNNALSRQIETDYRFNA
tara:strand:- start:457 stop:1398 length:942 start_codon:yes stop_codon:yes gene_type:complete